MSLKPIQLGPNDNVVINMEEGPLKGHKLASKPIPKNSPVVKFGHWIATATSDIEVGEHVHVHNTCLPRELHGDPSRVKTPSLTQKGRTFQGFLRSDGTAGTRNYIVVVGTVNCSATVVKAVCNHFLKTPPTELGLKGIDGIVPITHASGCAQAIGGYGHDQLNRTLSGWIFHSNVVGALVIGLGCEGTTFETLMESRKIDPKDSPIPLKTFDIQEVGGTSKAIAHGIEKVQELLRILPEFKRTELPVSKLKVALNCGGSDSFSAITANPALGHASDRLVVEGGTVALAEIPECHGAEELLFQRAASEQVRTKLKTVFQWWQDYAGKNGVSLNNNLAPGNIAGGISTILEKTLGSIAKGGATPLEEVVDYAEPIQKNGFTLMNTPGFDPVSVTGLVAGGCNLVAFTTGRGSVYGCSIAPTLKISSNSELFRKMGDDMDFNAGEILNQEPIEKTAEDLFEKLISVASGEKTASEKLGLGWEEFTPWPVAETL